MGRNIRVTYRRTNSYNTASNKIRKVRTPGGRLVAQHIGKRGKGVSCGDCGILLPGIHHLRPQEYHRISKSRKTVKRVYGGNRCANCVRDRIMRAFLIEEHKIVKKVSKTKKKKPVASR